MRYKAEIFFCVHARSLLVRMASPMEEAIVGFESLHVETIVGSRQTLAIVESLQTLADVGVESWVLWKAPWRAPWHPALATGFQGARRLADRIDVTCS